MIKRAKCQEKKSWRQRQPMLMEVSLVGALLLYSTISLEYFPPSNVTCCTLIWFRALGFVAFYGSMTLKLR
uniref:G-protein coupled receptors family 3 profile domain-containing protein n=1 Tax=Romanomermis culicivorax TaxID=13658 RepID=A0A915IAY5_ROMCU